jgi:hypothetical protein
LWWASGIPEFKTAWKYIFIFTIHNDDYQVHTTLADSEQDAMSCECHRKLHVQNCQLWSIWWLNLIFMLRGWLGRR